MLKTLRNLALVYRAQKKDKDAARFCNQITGLLSEFRPEKGNRFFVLAYTAECLMILGERLETAEKCIRVVIENNEKHGKINAESLKILAMILRGRKKFDESNNVFKDAISTVDEEKDERHPGRADVRVEFAKSLIEQKKFKVARAQIEGALEIQQKALRSDHPVTAETKDLMKLISNGLEQR